MLATDRVKEIFADAHAMQNGALEHWDAGDIRDAAEKAWCATLRATNALILARSGEEPEITTETARRLDRLARQEQRARSLVGRYYSRQVRLHGDCFYSGILSDVDEIERRIRESIDYIRDAEALAPSRTTISSPISLTRESKAPSKRDQIKPHYQREATPPHPHSSLFQRTPLLPPTRQTAPRLPPGLP